MQLSQIPNKIAVAFATGGGKNTIPTASQIGTTAGAASYTDGFPPLTRTPLAAGGVPPSGTDMNGVLFDMSSIARYTCAGGVFAYDSTFSTAIGGYPNGSIISAADGTLWRSRIDNNAVAPGGAGWVSANGVKQAGPFSVNASRTLTAAESVGNMVIFFGTTAAISVTLPGHSDCDNGATINFFNASGFAVTLVAAGSDTINPSTLNLPNIILQSGDTLSIAMFLAATTWEVLGGSAQLNYSPGFVSALTVNGFKKIGTFLMQWGAASTDGSGNVTVAYPIAFPNAAFVVIPTPANSTGTVSASAYGGTKTQVSFKATASGTAAATNINYIAIGW